MKLKSYGYTRVSSVNQISGDGFSRQKRVITDYAEKHGIDIVKIFRESTSGVKAEIARPVFQQMVAEILSNGINTVIIEALDRLAREYRIQESLLIYLASRNIQLLSARTEEDVTAAILSDPMKKALVQIQGIFSELEKNLLVRKLRLAREAKKKATGKCEGRKSLKELNPALIKEMRRLRRTKPGYTRMTYGRIAESLNAQGFVGANNQPFNENSIKTFFNRMK